LVFSRFMLSFNLSSTTYSAVSLGVRPQQLFNMVTEMANNRLFLTLRMPFLRAI